MSKVGIDAIGFYTPRYCLDLATLAAARNIDVNKLYTGLGQKRWPFHHLMKMIQRSLVGMQFSQNVHLRNWIEDRIEWAYSSVVRASAS